MDWVGDFGLYWGHVIEIQILKQYYAQYYAYVKQNTVNIVILLQLHLVLLKWLIAPVMNWIHYHLLLAFGFIYSGVNFFFRKNFCSTFFFAETIFLWSREKTTTTAKLTLQLSWVTKTEFLLTISIQYQADKWWE